MAKVRATITMADYERPEGFDPAGYSWRAELRYRGRRMTVPFFTGSACGEPTAEDVLYCLCADAAGFENAAGFEDWAGEYGYSPDSRKAERTYRAVERQTRKLRALLGGDYESLVYADEDAVRAACAG